MLRKTLAASAVALVALAALSQAQDSLRFDKTVPYRLDQTLQLGARVGPVRVDSVVLSTGGGAGGGIMSRIPRPGAGDPEVTTTIQAAFDTQNPQEDEWEVTYTLDFLDSNGRLIDRATKKAELEGEAKIVNVEHSTLKYVVSSIARVRIRLEAKYD
jgi:hypothetical protein